MAVCEKPVCVCCCSNRSTKQQKYPSTQYRYLPGLAHHQSMDIPAVKKNSSSVAGHMASRDSVDGCVPLEHVNSTTHGEMLHHLLEEQTSMQQQLHSKEEEEARGPATSPPATQRCLPAPSLTDDGGFVSEHKSLRRMLKDFSTWTTGGPATPASAVASLAARPATAGVVGRGSAGGIRRGMHGDHLASPSPSTDSSTMYVVPLSLELQEPLLFDVNSTKSSESNTAPNATDTMPTSRPIAPIARRKCFLGCSSDDDDDGGIQPEPTPHRSTHSGSKRTAPFFTLRAQTASSPARREHQRRLEQLRKAQCEADAAAVARAEARDRRRLREEGGRRPRTAAPVVMLQTERAAWKLKLHQLNLHDGSSNLFAASCTSDRFGRHQRQPIALGHDDCQTRPPLAPSPAVVTRTDYVASGEIDRSCGVSAQKDAVIPRSARGVMLLAAERNKLLPLSPSKREKLAEESSSGRPVSAPVHSCRSELGAKLDVAQDLSVGLSMNKVEAIKAHQRSYVARTKNRLRELEGEVAAGIRPSQGKQQQIVDREGAVPLDKHAHHLRERLFDIDVAWRTSVSPSKLSATASPVPSADERREVDALRRRRETVAAAQRLAQQANQHTAHEAVCSDAVDTASHLTPHHSTECVSDAESLPTDVVLKSEGGTTNTSTNPGGVSVKESQAGVSTESIEHPKDTAISEARAALVPHAHDGEHEAKGNELHVERTGSLSEYAPVQQVRPEHSVHPSLAGAWRELAHVADGERWMRLLDLDGLELQMRECFVHDGPAAVREAAAQADGLNVFDRSAVVLQRFARCRIAGRRRLRERQLERLALRRFVQEDEAAKVLQRFVRAYVVRDRQRAAQISALS